MKQLLTFVYAAMILQLYAQDTQWYVRNSEFINGNCQGNSIQISGIKALNRNIDRGGDPTRDIFVILENGEHYNSYKHPIRNETLLDATYYNFRFDAPIKYFYHTFVYDDGDDPNRLTIGCSVNSSFDYLDQTTPTESITINHTPVIGKDITYILDTKNSIADTFIYDNRFYEFDLETSNLMNKSIIFFKFGNDTLHIQESEIGIIKNYLYLNFKVKKHLDKNLINSFIKVTYKTGGDIGSGRQSHTRDDQLLPAHDPNYVSFCYDSFSNMIHYHLEIENTGFAPADSVSFEFVLPDFVNIEKYCLGESKFAFGDNIIISNIPVDTLNFPRIHDYTSNPDDNNDPFGNNLKPETNPKPYFEVDNNTRLVTAGFRPGASLGYKKNNNRASMDFCFNLDTSKLNTLKDCFIDTLIKPKLCKTFFGSKSFIITSFYGICSEMYDAYSEPIYIATPPSVFDKIFGINREKFKLIPPIFLSTKILDRNCKCCNFKKEDIKCWIQNPKCGRCCN